MSRSTCCTAGPGEDGTLQGILEILGIPYSHSGVHGVGAGDAEGHRQGGAGGRRRAGAGRQVVSRREAAKGHLLPPPYVIKPIAEGSSVGVFIVTEQHEHPPQELTREDWAFGEQVLVERYIPGKELTCAVMGDKASDVIEIVPRRGSTTTRRNTRPAARSTSAGANFTFCLPRGPKTSAQGASRPRLPRRDPR